MVADPVVDPVTTPAVTLATEDELVQEPPIGEPVSVRVAGIHKVPGPAGVMVAGTATVPKTVTIKLVAEAK